MHARFAAFVICFNGDLTHAGLPQPPKLKITVALGPATKHFNFRRLRRSDFQRLTRRDFVLAIGVDCAICGSKFVFENEALLEIAASPDKFGGRLQREEASGG